jgi:hypothetical protein
MVLVIDEDEPKNNMKVTRSSLKQLLQGVTGTQSPEIGCDECWDVLDLFAELELAGKDPAQDLPLVENHLVCCEKCRDEYAAFLEALKNLPG